MRSSILFLLIAGMAFVAGIWGFRTFSAAPVALAEPVAGNAATKLSGVSFPDVTGTSRSLSEWSGKILVVNFWATWCPPCKEEMPEFDRLQKEYGPRGVQFVGIALDEWKAVTEYLASKPVSYPVLLGEPNGVAWAESLGNTMQVLPFTAVFDTSGNLVEAKAGPYMANELTALFDRLIGRK